MTGTVRSVVPGIAWPGVPDGRGAELLAMLWQLRRSERWSPDVLRARQFEQLRCLAVHAVARVPRYKGVPADRGIEPARMDVQDFGRWPILSKGDVRADPHSLHAVEYPATHGAWTETSTSGSTGEPVRVRHTELTGLLARALVARDHLAHGRDLGGKFAAIRLLASERSAPGWGVMGIAFDTGPSATMDILAGISEQLDWLLDQAPAYLLSHPSNLRALILEARRLGRRPQGLLGLISFGEMSAPDLGELARDCWGVDVVDTYSCREAGSLAFQCPESDVFHVNAEGVYLEVLGEDGAPCEPGETGRVVITPLHNFAMPLIRYQIGDYAEVGDACPCGRGLPVLKRILGRVTNMAVDPTGRRFWPGLRASMLTQIAPFRQLRLVQEAIDRIELLYVMDRELTAPEQAQCADALARMLRYRYAFGFIRVPVLERGPGGKYEDFVSRLQP